MNITKKKYDRNANCLLTRQRNEIVETIFFFFKIIIRIASAWGADVFQRNLQEKEKMRKEQNWIREFFSYCHAIYEKCFRFPADTIHMGIGLAYKWIRMCVMRIVIEARLIRDGHTEPRALLICCKCIYYCNWAGCRRRRCCSDTLATHSYLMQWWWSKLFDK